MGTALAGALATPQSTIDLFRNNSGIFPFQTDQYQGILKIDHRFSDRDQLIFRYNVTKSRDENPNVSALVGVSRGYVQEIFDSNALLRWNRTFSPTAINEARVQWDYYNPLTASNEAFGPALEIAGYGFFNRDRFLPADLIGRRYEMADNLTWVKSKHTIKVGAYVLLRKEHDDSKTFMSGRFTFGTLPGALLAGPDSAIGGLPGGGECPGDGLAGIQPGPCPELSAGLWTGRCCRVLPAVCRLRAG